VKNQKPLVSRSPAEVDLLKRSLGVKGFAERRFQPGRAKATTSWSFTVCRKTMDFCQGAPAGAGTMRLSSQQAVLHLGNSRPSNQLIRSRFCLNRPS
jgi:hypothetical protein